ncbi:hypothetical protein PI124_g18333 [Phytophthora idaei]|nr:hypothetical protein PI124_g18333 [Phytophthora idaei]
MAQNVDVSEKVATRDSPTEMIATKVEMIVTADISTARAQPLLQNEVKDAIHSARIYREESAEMGLMQFADTNLKQKQEGFVMVQTLLHKALTWEKKLS